MRRIRDKRLGRILLEIDSLLGELLEGKYQLILFGSRARGEETEFSDVDLMVILDDEECNFENKEEIREMVHDFSIKYPYLFSVMIVSKSIAQERKGLLVFDSLDKEGIVIGG